MEKMPAILTTGSLLELPTTGNPSRRTHGTTAFAPVLARRLGKLLGRNDPAENRTGMWGGTDAKQANKADKAAQTPDRSSWRSDTQQEASTDSLPHGLSLPLPEDVLAAMGSLRPHWQESREVPPVESGDTSPVKMSRGVHKVAATCIVPALEPLVRSIPHLGAIAATPASPFRLSEPSGLFEYDGAAVAAHPTQPALGAAETTAEPKTAQLQDAGNRPPGAKTSMAEGIGASGREATVGRWSKGAIAVAKAGVNTTQVASKPAPGVSIVAEYEGIQEFAAGQVGTDRAGIGRKMVKHAGKNLGRVAPQVAPQQATPTRVATPWTGSQQTVPVRIDPEQAAS
ncbi:MAG TPA: hypothetical protein GXZ82_03175, partial [Firmicutes bacterium]|nr:hypothetical protein [Bacillota bacterium]